ncbi:MAG: Deoxyribose-phosphate aldolase [Alphaproteobacteria bacterium MarineAlpha2_Bin1]|nr:MAG: Deoxyribose-phosphate aldolase [Alphaproteobacteria bacterium MarineAlpha2_Bin1]
MKNITKIDNHFSRMKTEKNYGIDFTYSLIENIKSNKSAIEKRTTSMQGRRSIKKQWQAAWLLKAITLLDLTTLSGDDSPSKVERLCFKAKNPLRQDLVSQFGFERNEINVAAVCVYHSLIGSACKKLLNTNIPVAAVSAGFPAGLSPLETRLKEISLSIRNGAKEIDIVIDRSNIFKGDWRAIYEEVKSFKEICRNIKLKAIIATGDISTFKNIYRASMVCMMAGADFIKTSTGKEATNATLPVSLVMVRAIRDYFDITGYKVGFKAAGGISTSKDSLSYMILIKEELGNDWLNPNLFRIGASSLLSDIERQLEHHITGRYSSFNRHSMC